ncbi:MAG: hypothetical protein H0U67_06620, partial [Gemmatimonadetes bacterium]|nr:hypothetical protein [Gemmatimonadota bacterium]
GSLVVLAVVLSGCMYGFVGGGLPSHVRTVAILPFANETTQPLIETEIVQRLQTELPRNLGVRLAEEQRADAVVRGRVIAYEEVAASVRPTQDQQQVPVVQRQVRITYELEIYDVREDKPLWRAQAQAALGNFLPERGETPQQGRDRAIRELVQKVIEGAQSQW